MGNKTGKVVVTGGAGFIGSHLVDRLLADGLRVVVCDNFSSGRPENLQHLAGCSELELLEVDLTEHERLAACLQGADAVFHLAALADIVPSIERPRDYHRANVEGTVSLLEACRSAGVGKVVYAASSSCYGIPDACPTPEDADIRPMYPYALTKYVAEEYVLFWGQLYGIPVVSLRLFNVYGPRSRTSGAYGAVFGVFLAQKLAGKPFTVVGDGEQTRDFTYVTDVVDAFVAAANSGLTREVMNVGSGHTYSVNRLIELLGGGEKVFIPKRPGEPDSTFADTTKIRKLLDWKPQVTIEEGVSRLLAHIDYWKEAPVWDETSIAKATQSWFSYLAPRS